MTIPNRQGAPLTYARSGVDIDAGNALVAAIRPIVRATRRPGADGDIGGFGGVFDLAAAGYADPLLVAAADGVGTKLGLAIEAGRLDTVGVDLVAMCVNDLVVQGAEPLFFLDYYASGRLDPDAAAAVIGGIGEGCRLAGAALIGGETAEMPGLYHGDDFDLAGFAVGAVERERLLPRPDVAAGDTILGLASSGPHSNGFSLIRAVLAATGARLDAPAPFDGSLTLAEALLVPTRIYVRPLLNVLRRVGGIKALAHITGGGLVENVPRVLPDRLAAAVDLDRVPVPAVFRWLAASGPIENAEMLRTFNCGVGMVVVAAADRAGAVAEALADEGETVFALGTVTERGDRGVVVSGSLDGAFAGNAVA